MEPAKKVPLSPAMMTEGGVHDADGGGDDGVRAVAMKVECEKKAEAANKVEAAEKATDVMIGEAEEWEVVKKVKAVRREAAKQRESVMKVDAAQKVMAVKKEAVRTAQ